ncbi:antitoxin VbhA family protein [Microbacterium natoriense]|uniref:antitoxin VbhA family protein n=1 Tax=Microbacterium natoriense TaxID=284570 RepID=UPI00358FF20B
MAGISKDRAIYHAIHSSRLAGLPPEPDELAILQDFAEDRIDRAEFRAAMRAAGARKAGIGRPRQGSAR